MFLCLLACADVVREADAFLEGCLLLFVWLMVCCVAGWAD